MQFSVLTFVLSVAVAVTFATPLPATIGGLTVKRHEVDGVPVNLWRRTDGSQHPIDIALRKTGVFRVLNQLERNNQVYNVTSLSKPNERFLAIKYEQSVEVSRQRPFGGYSKSYIGRTRSHGAQWVIREALSKDLKFFILTPQYEALLRAHANDKKTLHKEVQELIAHAAELAANSVHSKGLACWRYMGGYKLNDFMFNFEFDHPWADVLMVPMNPIEGELPTQQNIRSMFLVTFLKDLYGGQMGGVTHQASTPPPPARRIPVDHLLNH